MTSEQELTHNPATDLLRLMNDRARLAKEFRERTGLKPEDIVFCETVDETGMTKSWFEPKRKHEPAA